jgi:hypothetical protein
MNILRLALPLSLLTLAACSSSSSSSAPPSEAAAIGVTATWEALPYRSGSFASASAGSEGAVVYLARQPLGSAFIVKLQRVDARGAVQGAAIELGLTTEATPDPSGLTVATNGDHYVACWTSTASISCASAPVGEGGATPGLSIAGESPSLAYAAGAWALAYRVGEGPAAQLAVVRMGSDAKVAGAPALFEGGCAEGCDADDAPRLAATTDAFVLVGSDESGKATVRWLDVALKPISSPIDLGVPRWFHAAVAASGERAAVSIGHPYGFHVFLLDRQGVVSAHDPRPGKAGKEGVRVGLVPEGASFGMLWQTPDGFRYDAIERAIEAGDIQGDFDGFSLLRIQDGEFYVRRRGDRFVVGRATR